MAGFQFGADPLVPLASGLAGLLGKKRGKQNTAADTHNQQMHAALSVAQQRATDSVQTMAEREHAHGLAKDLAAQAHRHKMASLRFDAAQLDKVHAQVATAKPSSPVAHDFSIGGVSSNVKFVKDAAPKASATPRAPRNSAAAAANAATSSKTTKL